MSDELEELREQIDAVDREIVRLFGERMALTDRIGEYKKKNGLPVLDASREDKKLEAVLNLSSDELKPYAAELFRGIMALSRQKQENGVVCRLAEECDLDEIRALFTSLVRHMNTTGVTIWNDVYPNEEFPRDIAERRLYVLEKGGGIIAAFALLEPFKDTAKSTVRWTEDGEDALYLYRLGVNADHLGKGYACLAMDYAKAITRARGRKYLRLYVVDTNTPAVKLYAKTGFIKAPGTRCDDVATDVLLIESGFEARV